MKKTNPPPWIGLFKSRVRQSPRPQAHETLN